MATTQDSLPIEDIKDNLVFLKDGGAAVIIQTSAVNFGLLSMEEQMAIIGSFAQMINSLSFPIQITILSKRLDISAYLKLLEKAQMNQTNPLLGQMMIRYRRFIQSLIKDNEVLDKQFYISVPLASIEMGLGVKKEERVKKARTILDPKKDQVIRQLNRIGLNAKQLNDEQLLKFFYEMFNPPEIGGPQIPATPANFVSLNEPAKVTTPPQPTVPPAQVVTAISPTPTPTSPPVAAPPPQPQIVPAQPAISQPQPTPLPDASTLAAQPIPVVTQRPNNTNPFVVVELSDSV